MVDDPSLPGFTCNKTVFHKNHALTIQNLSLFHNGGRILFENADCSIPYDSVTGLVGINGSGKSSLVKLIASKTLPGFPDSINIEYLAASDDEEYLNGMKELDEEESSELFLPVDYIQNRVKTRSDQLAVEINELERRLETASLAEVDMEVLTNELSDLYDLQETIAERFQRELDQAISETGLATYAGYALKDLSCGWRYKTRLIAAFLTHPDLLVIDEPSFLDANSTDWLIQKTKEIQRECMVVLISHKEHLLDTLCDHILYINAANQTLASYHCRYSVFRDVHQTQVQVAQKMIACTEKKHATAEKSLQNLQATLKKREKNLKEITSQNADRRFIKGKNKEAKQNADKSAASKLKQTKRDIQNLEDVQRQARTERVKSLHLDSIPVDGRIVSLVDVAFSYSNDEFALFVDVDTCMEATDRVLLAGPNGCGKSTLVKLILGELKPSAGTVSRKGQAIYFPQTALCDLLRRHGNETACDFLRIDTLLTESQARNHLGSFGLVGRDLVVRMIRTLSAGQRVRLWLAKQQLHIPKASMLVVDEISENVDVETRKSLVELISTFNGAVLIVSHDPDFLQHLSVTKIWELQHQRIKERFPDS